MKTKMCNINISINIKIFSNTFYYLFLRNKSVGRERRPTRNTRKRSVTAEFWLLEDRINSNLRPKRDQLARFDRAKRIILVDDFVVDNSFLPFV